MREALLVPLKVSRVYLYAGVMAVLLAFCVWLMFNVELVMFGSLRLTVMVVAFIGCMVFGYGTLYFFLRAREAPPVLKADDAGIYFDVSFINRGLVTWDNVKEYALVRHAGRNFLLIHMKSPFTLIDDRDGIRRRILLASLKRYGTPAAIPASIVSGDPGEVLRQLADYGRSRDAAAHHP
jgi:hypothetical protein